MKQKELVKKINDSIEHANKLMLEWTDNRYFLGSSSPRLEGFMGSIIMQNIMIETENICITPEHFIKKLPELDNEDITNKIERLGRFDISIFNKKWNLIYPIEIKRERLNIDPKSKIKRGCIKDLERLAEIQKLLPKMKAGILAVFIFAQTSNPTKLDNLLKKRKKFWKDGLINLFLNSQIRGVDILPKFSQNPPQKWFSENSNGEKTHYIATSLCIVVKSF